MRKGPLRWLAWPLPLFMLAIPGALVLVVGLALTIESFSWRPEWPRTSALAHEHLSLVAPIVSAVAFHRWATLAQTPVIFGASRLGETEQPENWANFVRVWVVSAVAYTVALVPIFVHTATSATFGRPDVLAVATAYAGLGFAVAFGQLLANIVPNPILSPLAAVLMFVVVQLPQVVSPALGVALPVQWDVPRLNEIENPVALVFRCLVLLAVILLMVGASQVVRRADQRSGVLSPSVALAVVGSALLLSLPAVRPPDRLIAQQAPPTVCSNVAGMPVCVHQGHGADLGAMTGAAQRLVDAYGKRPVGIDSIHDSAALPAGDRPPSSVAVQLNFDESAEHATAAALSDAMAGYPSCLRKIEDDGDLLVFQADLDYASELARWLRYQAGIRLPDEFYEPEPGSFFDQPAPRVQEWIESNESAIVNCERPATS